MGPRSLYRSLSLFLSALSLSSLGVASGSAVPEVGATLWGVGCGGSHHSAGARKVPEPGSRDVCFFSPRYVHREQIVFYNCNNTSSPEALHTHSPVCSITQISPRPAFFCATRLNSRHMRHAPPTRPAMVADGASHR